MTPTKPPEKYLIRYSPKPLSFYKRTFPELRVTLGGLLGVDAAWNLAYLSHDFDTGKPPPHSSFCFHVRDTVSRVLGSPNVDGETYNPGWTTQSWFLLPAPQCVEKLTRPDVVDKVPMFHVYGQAWIDTIKQRARLCQVDDAPGDRITDLSTANQVLSKFR